MTRKLPAELVLEARKAFVEYEKVFVTRVAKRPGDRMSAQPIEDVLASGDEQQVRDGIRELRRLKDEILNSIVA